MPPPTFADLELRILGKQTLGYPVELRLDGEQELARDLLASAVALSIPSAQSQQPRVSGASCA
jgi:hypothetical protein